MSNPTALQSPASVSAESQPKSTGWGVALLVARLIVGGMMIYASANKLGDPVAFLKAVKQYELVPLHWNVFLNSIAVIVPWIELLGGAILILGLGVQASANAFLVTNRSRPLNIHVGLRGTALVLLLMLIAFTTAIALRTWDDVQTNGTPFMEVQFDCGCGTGIDIIWIKMIENGALILLSLFIVLSRIYGSRPGALPADTPLTLPPRDAGAG